MPAGRHRRRAPAQLHLPRVVAATATVLAGAVGVLAIDGPGGPSGEVRTAAAIGEPFASVLRAPAREASRDHERPEPAPRMAEVAGLARPVESPRSADLSPRWASVQLNVWSEPSEGSRLLTVLDAGAKVVVTGVTQGSWAQVARGDRLAWVHGTYLSRAEPSATRAVRSPGKVRVASAGVSYAPCPDGSSVESGLTTNAIKVYRAVCAAFPAVSRWGGRSGSGGDHGSGHALDIMCTGSLGDSIAAWVRAHASELGVSYVIWAQHIWSVERASEGWRAMPDRGSVTANHYDHVHVSVY